MVMLVRLLQPENAELPMLVTLLGISYAPEKFWGSGSAPFSLY